MRYPKGSFVITASGDIPLLRTVRNARFVSHQQLFELTQYDSGPSSRPAFNWRTQRLLKTGHIQRVEKTCWNGSAVYSIARRGLAELESQGEFAIALHSGTRRMPDPAQVFHALELNAIRLALARNSLLVQWRTEVEISSTNMVSDAPYQKDYDAIVEVWVKDQVRQFALEYERSLKSMKAYEKIRAALESERRVACVLYLTAHSDLLLALMYQLTPLAQRLGFLTATSFREQLLKANVATDRERSTVSLESFLEFAHPLYVQR
jgi:hypothetical protein